MNQPELGNKIAELRKSKGYTQQELSDKCNINIRTLQRIESGKVEPRVYSIKLILEVLGYNYEDIFGDEEPSSPTSKLTEKLQAFLFVKGNIEGTGFTNGLFWAWIMGILYFISGFPDSILSTLAIESGLSAGEEVLLVVTKLVVLISYVFFMRGFVVLGKALGLHLLSTVSAILLFVFPAFVIMEIVAQLSGHNIMGVLVVEGICVGVLQIVFGYCLFISEREFGRIGVIAGVLEILAGIMFVTVILGFLGLFLLIPIEILEIQTT